jgi:hypothetical protein
VLEASLNKTLLAQDQTTSASQKYDGKSISEWIADWDAGNFNEAQKAQHALVKIGAPAIPKLVRLVKENHRHAEPAELFQLALSRVKNSSPLAPLRGEGRG